MSEIKAWMVEWEMVSEYLPQNSTKLNRIFSKEQKGKAELFSYELDGINRNIRIVPLVEMEVEK